VKKGNPTPFIKLEIVIVNPEAVVFRNSIGNNAIYLSCSKIGI